MCKNTYITRRVCTQGHVYVYTRTQHILFTLVLPVIYGKITRDICMLICHVSLRQRCTRTNAHITSTHITGSTQGHVQAAQGHVHQYHISQVYTYHRINHWDGTCWVGTIYCLKKNLTRTQHFKFMIDK